MTDWTAAGLPRAFGGSWGVLMITVYQDSPLFGSVFLSSLRSFRGSLVSSLVGSFVQWQGSYQSRYIERSKAGAYCSAAMARGRHAGRA